MPTRRAVLSAALGAGAAATLTGRAAAAEPLPAPPPPGPAVPRTLTAVGAAGTSVTPGFPVGHVGVTWSGPPVGGSIRFRDAQGWGAWRPLTEGCSPEPARTGALVAGGGALGYEVAPPAGAADPTVLAVNTTDGPAIGRAAPAADGLDVAAIGALPGGRRASPRLGRGFRYRSRAGWGADESFRFTPEGTERFPEEYHPVQTLTVHHTADGSDSTDYPARVRAMYAWHIFERDFGDIGYHLLIDPEGTVYEGRWSGADGRPVFGPAGPDGEPLLSSGAHVGGFNAGNVGVALMGNLNTAGPTPEARRTLVRVLAVLADVTGVDPVGRVDYVNPVNGRTRTMDAISGHRDWAANECPGESFYPQLPAIRQEVAALLAARP